MGTRKDYAYGKSKYVKAEDLVGKTVRVTISDVEDVQFDDKGVKPVLSFEGKEKGLVVNATNFDTLAASLGSNTMDRTRDRAQGRKGSLQGPAGRFDKGGGAEAGTKATAIRTRIRGRDPELRSVTSLRK